MDEVERMSMSMASAQRPMRKPMWQTMAVFLIPLMLSNALQSVGQLIGSIVVGRWIGVNALAAISAFFPLFFLLVSVAIGIGTGSAILIGQAYGARNHERLKAIVGNSLTVTFLLGVIFAALGGVFTVDILRLTGTPENVLATSAHYARVLFWSLPVMFLYLVYTTLLRGTGDSKTPFYLLSINTGLNLALLPVFTFGWLGVPKLGVYGPAYASMVSTVLTLIVMIFWLSKVKHPLQFDTTVRKHLRLDFALLKLILRLGVPSSLGMILFSLSEIAVITFVNQFGSDATAAYGAVNQVVGYVQMPAISIGVTVSIYTAQSIGAHQLDRLREVFRAGIALNYVLGGALIVLVYVLAQGILSLFLTSTSTLRMAHTLLMMTLWSYLVFGHAQVVSATMRASGTVLWPLVFSVGSIWGMEVPVAYVLSHYTDLGIRGIWLGYPAGFLVSLSLQYAYYRLSWKTKTITRLVQ